MTDLLTQAREALEKLNAAETFSVADALEYMSIVHKDFVIALCERLIELEEKREWQPIETAPKSGQTLLLGFWNELGKWRTLRGQWVTQAEIEEWWDSEDSMEGWYEMSVEADDPPTCWPTNPTHWMPLPAAPTQEKDHD